MNWQDGPFKPLLSTGGIVLTTSFADVYTPPAAPSNLTVIITSLIFVNADSAAQTITLHRVEPGGSEVAANIILPTVSIPANKTWCWTPPRGLAVPQGWKLRAKASAGLVVTFTPDGIELQS